VDYAIVHIDNQVIDEINILQATLLAMKRAVLALNHKIDLCLIDGISKPDLDLPMETIIKGDEKVPSIGAASILAKVARDNLMLEMHQKWPEYGFDQHKGYGTALHRQMLQNLGPCPIHRKTFLFKIIN